MMALQTLILAGLGAHVSCWAPTHSLDQMCPPGRESDSSDAQCKKTAPCDPDDPPADAIIQNKGKTKQCMFNCSYPFCNKGGMCNCIQEVNLNAFAGCGFMGCSQSRGDGAVCIDSSTTKPITLSWRNIGKGICICKPGFCTVCGACVRLGVPAMLEEVAASEPLQAQLPWVLFLTASCFMTVATISLVTQRWNSRRNSIAAEPLLGEYVTE